MSPAVAELIKWIWAQGWLQSNQPLPSANELALARNVSKRQMLRALHWLEEAGILTIKPGGYTEVIKLESPDEKSPKGRLRSETEIANRIYNGIATGEFRAGESLPKAEWLCLEWRISTRVLTAACRSLANKNLLYKSGKSWMVGAQGEIETKQATLRRRSIVVVMNRPEEWAEFHSNLLDDMARSIELEANRLKVNLVPVLTGELSVSKTFPMGKKEIRKVILELGDSFCGLILTPLHQHLSGFSDWCSWLLKFAKPLVWLQDYEPQQIVAQPHPNFYRVNYGAWVNPDMETEADLALKEIFNKGHRKVVFACNDPKVYHWFRLRLQGFLKSKYASGVEIIALEKTISDAALMKLVLQVADITCLIVPNDRYAIRYWQVLTEMGIKIPRDLSMISFDNLADLHPFPISSVDFGMANLGYKVIHILLNDIPVETIKKTHLMGLCQLIDRGSVGTPRKNIRLGDKD